MMPPISLLNVLQSHEYLRATLKLSNNLADLALSGVSAQSKACKPGYLFVAKAGATSNSRDGHDFIDQAISLGACAVVVDKNWHGCASLGVPIIRAQHSARALSYLCEAFWGFPSTKLKLIGITGTNGKTSTSFMLHSILQTAGFKPRVMGTLGLGNPGELSPLSHTTMEPEFMSQSLAKLAQAGVSHVVTEVSSHGLALERVTALSFAAVGLSNITQDHLDFHGSMSAYILAKQKLFEEVANDSTEKVLPLNHAFDPAIEKLARLKLYDPEFRPKGLRLPGDFQAHNASLASALAHALGIDPVHIERGLERCPPIPGRLEPIPNSRCQLFIDFAHTPDALMAVLQGLRKMSSGQLILVFGCGGERDQEKRPLMGQIANDLADLVIVTDDNPRCENPSTIRAAIVAGMKDAALGVMEIADRQEAIKTAIMAAGPQDLVLIAGKGHENYQIYGHERRRFSDQEVARHIVESL